MFARYLQGPSLDLAALRITVFAVVLLSRDVWDAPGLAELADALRIAPVGLGWSERLLPLSSAWATAALGLLVVTGALTIVGLFTRVASALAVVALGYLLAIPHFAGAGFHSHHLLWLAILVAASPSGSALSLDAWRARRHAAPEPPPTAIRFGLPVRAAWLVLGLVYLFPGLWKWSAGFDWAFGAPLRGQLYWKWAENGDFRPWPRIDEWPLALELGGVAVMIFEPLVVVGLLVSRLRPWTVGALLLFHAATAWLFRIQFPTLWLCLLVCVPWAKWLRVESPAPASTAPEPIRSWAPPAAAAALLAFGILVTGVLGIQNGYPFACYPTFHTPAAAQIPSLLVEADTEPGPVRINLGSKASQREWALQWQLALNPDPDRLSAWVEVLRTQVPELRGAQRIRVIRAHRQVDPRSAEAAPFREQIWPVRNP